MIDLITMLAGLQAVQTEADALFDLPRVSSSCLSLIGHTRSP